MMLLNVFVCILLFVSYIYGTPVSPPAVEQASSTDVSHYSSENTVNDVVREGKSIDNELYKGKIGAIEDALLRKLNSKCNQKDISSCVMLKLVTYMNRLLKKSSLEISETLEITQTSPVVEEEIRKEDLEMDESRGYTDESVFGEIISEKLWSFVKSRSLKWKLLPEADVVLSTTSDNEGNVNMGVALRSAKAVETGRGKMKNAGPIIAAGIMKLGMLKVLAFKALALLVGKALLVSKLAFLLAAIIGLKKLFSQSKHVTYEVVAHPHHSHSAVESHGHGDTYSSGWGRSGDVAQNLAYRGHLQ
ncbi:hypothetical protein PGB90_005671 [Kerria lacca]